MTSDTQRADLVRDLATTVAQLRRTLDNERAFSRGELISCADAVVRSHEALELAD